MGTSIRALLLSQMDSFTPSEQKVAQALLERYPSLGLGPIAQFAKQAEVSDPTVFRFVVRIGFPNYSSFQQALHDEIDTAMNSPLARMDAFHSETGMRDSHAAIFQRLSESLAATIEGLDAAAFDAAVAVLADPDVRIFCGGGRYTAPLASLFSFTLAYARPRVQYVEPNVNLASVALVDMGRNDVLVIFDFRRYQKDSIRFAQAAHRLGARILLITDEWRSPIAAFAEIVLRIQGRPFAMLQTNVPALALTEALVIAVTNRLPELARQRMEKIERLNAGGIEWDTNQRDLPE
ncbi:MULTISPECIES: MurR/RpiR family transcriptional regulator [Burkholderia]|uniref:RpiR family transcriptional regulator n=2 Tax=Burkholderia cepacia complex TaxID=87882 RepID=A0AAW3PPF5_9BURK|nr:MULTISPECIES: MurR/RpiR family transcriptional regulator [Burkholderia]KVE07472.1 RpiR family transcriptional regulator [Burkholderia anthina]KWZ29752.1 RpiR family transcriptional regulator [Burkholderia anthina]MCA8033288.1 MurR/RpiR family transcriptional regulator [Burkholderia arboris]RQV84991.1 MurR/RpiR family transcriptional regulator [Burkholderia anthina]RQX83847.1 MurR/RpiR family transcriptional regulator [Burkholderia anthina]